MKKGESVAGPDVTAKGDREDVDEIEEELWMELETCSIFLDPKRREPPVVYVPVYHWQIDGPHSIHGTGLSHSRYEGVMGTSFDDGEDDVSSDSG